MPKVAAFKRLDDFECGLCGHVSQEHASYQFGCTASECFCSIFTPLREDLPLVMKIFESQMEERRRQSKAGLN